MEQALLLDSEGERWIETDATDTQIGVEAILVERNLSGWSRAKLDLGTMDFFYVVSSILRDYAPLNYQLVFVDAAGPSSIDASFRRALIVDAGGGVRQAQLPR